MDVRRAWVIRSTVTCAVVNGLMIGVFVAASKQVLAGMEKWLAPFKESANGTLPADVQAAFAGMGQLVKEIDGALAPVTAGVGAVLTLLLILLLSLQGRRLLRSLQPEPVPASSSAARPSGELPPDPDAGQRRSQQPSSPVHPHQTAVQLLAIFQREGRLVDFLQEDLTQYSDDQIGAAVRSIHQGCREALGEHLELQPVMEKTEGSAVTVPVDFDPAAIRLTGNVSGDPPFSGILRHHGWRVVSVKLPQVTTRQDKDWILAPAEVEIAD